VRIGTFRIAAEDPRFSTACELHGVELVFPRQPVWICPAEGRPFVADAGTVTVYTEGVPFSRRSLDGRDEHCDWFSVPVELARQAMVELAPHASHVDGPVSRPRPVPCDAGLFGAQRRLLTLARAGLLVDDLEIEERVAGLLAMVARAMSPSTPTPTARGAGAVAERVKVVLSRRYRERHCSLHAIASDAAVSPYYMSRAFRAATGCSVHAYRNRLRVRAAAEALGERAVDVGTLAIELGFADPSHFARAFRREIGATPAAFRRFVRSGGRQRAPWAGAPPPA
jgi:AraC-like DNA-binding protein